ncbi:MAG: DUF6786 family protein, partial [Sphingobacterium sp.]
MKTKLFKAMMIFSVLFSACQGNNKETGQPQKGKPNFADDLTFLQKWDQQLIVLSASGGEAKLIVSPKYQGKVFTSTAEGEEGKSFGWINYKAFDKAIDPHMNAYGGEDRLWLGPEGGPFSLFFAPKKEMVFDNWRTPAAIDTESWSLVSSSTKSVRLAKDMELQNYAGTQFKINVNRQVEILERKEIEG